MKEIQKVVQKLSREKNLRPAAAYEPVQKHKVTPGIESTKITSMEDVSTGVLEKNKEYLRSKDKAKKWYDVSRHI